MANKVLVAVGASMLGLAVLVPIIMAASADDGWDQLAIVVMTFVFFGPVGLVGLILLIVGAVRGRGQQQQQQVIVVAGPPPAHMGPACRSCRSPLGLGARFCNACGQPA